MSGGLIARTKVSAAANGFRRLAAGLRKVADGDVVDEVLGQVAAQMAGITRDKIARHARSGFAGAHSGVKRDSSGIEVHFPRYLSLRGNGWFPFGRGLPRFIVARASKLLRERIKASITNR